MQEVSACDPATTWQRMVPRGDHENGAAEHWVPRHKVIVILVMRVEVCQDRRQRAQVAEKPADMELVAMVEVDVRSIQIHVVAGLLGA